MDKIKLFIDDKEIGSFDDIKDITPHLEGKHIMMSWRKDNELHIETNDVILT